MASIDKIKTSDGSGNASVATVQSVRSSGSSTIIVDTVAGIPDSFMGSMGTPHTFTDPITSETIVVISEATAVDFSGHVDGANLEIDDIAPGYVDGGSEIGDIVMIRPTTQWGDNVAEVLEVSHDDDGTLKAGAVDAAAVLASNVVTTAKIANANVTADKLATGAAAAAVATSQTTSSTSFTDLATTGPAVTVTIGANGLALVTIYRFGDSATVGAQPTMGFAVSGANTIAASDDYSVWHSVATSASQNRSSATFLLTGLTPGSTTFTAKYKNAAGVNSVTIKDRRIAVIPL